LKKHIAVLVTIAVVVMGQDRAAAQILPGKHYLEPFMGAFLANEELLRNGAIYPTPRPSDPTNPVITDIKLDPGLFFGLRYGYGLTRKLLVEAEFSAGISIVAIRQLEIKPDVQEGDQPQYETTTMDARILQYGVNLLYTVGTWRKLTPYFTFGAMEHVLDLRQKGESMPIRSAIVHRGGSGYAAAGERPSRHPHRDPRLHVQLRFDNQFIDPAQSGCSFPTVRLLQHDFDRGYEVPARRGRRPRLHAEDVPAHAPLAGGWGVGFEPSGAGWESMYGFEPRGASLAAELLPMFESGRSSPVPVLKRAHQAEAA
jgi:hypothetical protein